MVLLVFIFIYNDIRGAWGGGRGLKFLEVKFYLDS